MDLSYLQLTILAIIQGITEFLPISSSAHLILPSLILDWPDQGLTFDVAVHLGTLFAVLFYFRHDVLSLFMAWLRQITGQQASEESKLAWIIIIATIPGAVAGFFANEIVENYARSGIVLASTSALFAILLWYSDQVGARTNTLSDLNWKHGLLIGIAQALALIPGTSRSGITMTAALFCQLSRQASAKISFLLAIPIIFGSFLLRSIDLINNESVSEQLIPLSYGIVVSGIVAFACIHYFMRLIERVGFLPFVIYRLGLALFLFILTVAL
ncbi:MAG: undecaprenyl-diphosphate phosphatase [Pseudomonadales bacterium]|nr:undecaprenyl-diphosphate phosphatase [Pseudomonadales bacterium]